MVVISGPLLANGLRTEFSDTYSELRKTQADGRIGMIMDLGVGADNRRHEFGYYEAAPHMTYWPRGATVPTEGMGSVRFTGVVHNWARRIEWHKDDRADERTGSLMDYAQGAGRSAGTLPERFLIDLILGTTTTLPAVPLAPDGVAMFSATDAGGGDRFGVSSGNLLSGSGVASISAVLSDYYSGIEQYMLLQDGKGEPLLAPEMVAQGVVIIHGVGNTQIFEEAFLQKRQGEVMGTDAGVTPSNVVQDASRNVTLWPHPKITDNDWFMFLKAAPKKPTFLMVRDGIKEFQALEGDNNSDHVRTTGMEYVQWETRQGAGIALPYGAIKINN
jgi:hypothetical protein